MTAELEKIIPHSNRLNIQNLFPELDKLNFQGIPRRYEDFFQIGTRAVRRR